MGRKVSILGATSHWNKAPFHDPEMEIWSLNDMVITHPELRTRCDRWFQMHTKDEIARDASFGADYEKILRETGKPVYSCEGVNNVPKAIPYPLDAVCEWFHRETNGLLNPRGYFTMAISYMLALAICEGYEEIHLYGCDMGHESYYRERQNVEAYLMFAAGRGIKVYLPPESELLKAVYRYGYDDQPIREMNERLQVKMLELTQKSDLFRNSYERCQGALEMAAWFKTL